MFLRQRGAQGGISAGLWHVLSVFKKSREKDEKRIRRLKGWGGLSRGDWTILKKMGNPRGWEECMKLGYKGKTSFLLVFPLPGLELKDVLRQSAPSAMSAVFQETPPSSWTHRKRE